MLNSVTAFLDEHIALGAADRPAIVSPAGATTYGKLLARVNRTGKRRSAVSFCYMSAATRCRRTKRAPRTFVRLFE